MGVCIGSSSDRVPDTIEIPVVDLSASGRNYRRSQSNPYAIEPRPFIDSWVIYSSRAVSVYAGTILPFITLD